MCVLMFGCTGRRAGESTVIQRDDLVFRPIAEVEPFSFDSRREAEIDAVVRSVRDRLDVPSFAVGIVHRDRLVYAKAFGFRRLSDKQPADASTLYNIGSVSKPLTATLLAVLMEAGSVTLDDPVAKFLPASVSMPTHQGAPAVLTIRHLATHSSGLPVDPPNRDNVDHGLLLNPGQAKPYSVTSLYEAMARTQLLFKPGTQCRYSNFGFGLLGHVLERAAGQRLEPLLNDRLLQSLDMRSTTVTLTEQAARRFATHYWWDDPQRRDRPRTRFGDVFAHGGIISSVEDLAHFVAFHMGHGPDVLSDDSLRRLREPQSANDGTPLTLQRDQVTMRMCLGWRVQFPDQAGGIVNHSGEMDGHSAYVAFAPQAQVGVIVLANLGGARLRDANPTAATQLGVGLKQKVLYPLLGWSIGSQGR